MPSHQPVLVSEVIELFSPKPNDRLLDATVGHGGHARAYLEAANPRGWVVGLDVDPQAIASARQVLQPFQDRVELFNLPFHKIETLEGSTSTLFNHILFDLGVGSHQLGDTERGFSFRSPGPLTMAYGSLTDLPQAQVAALNALTDYLGRYPDVTDILAEMAEGDIAELIRHYGQERYAGRVATALKHSPRPQTANELAERITAALPRGYEHGRIHPATRTFQALRLAVNRELETLKVSLPMAAARLAPQGILAVITFHSLEERIVKTTFRTLGRGGILTKKSIGPTPEEVAHNPRSRSAKIRAWQRE